MSVRILSRTAVWVSTPPIAQLVTYRTFVVFNSRVTTIQTRTTIVVGQRLPRLITTLIICALRVYSGTLLLSFVHSSILKLIICALRVYSGTAKD